jgi:hypothetical protein
MTDDPAGAAAPRREDAKPYPIDAIRARVETCDSNHWLYDDAAAIHADRRELLQWYDTEQTMHAAWRKRAEEAEASLTARDRALAALAQQWRKEGEGYALGMMLPAPVGDMNRASAEVVRRCVDQLLAVLNDERPVTRSDLGDGSGSKTTQRRDP